MSNVLRVHIKFWDLVLLKLDTDVSVPWIVKKGVAEKLDACI